MPGQFLDSLLLFALSIPIVMKYRIAPVEGTPYWLFGVLFAALTVNCLISYAPALLGRWQGSLDRIKNILLLIILVIVLGGATVTSMVDREETAPVYGVHDIILQQEAAMRYLIVGKNPYQEIYFGTPVESFHYAEMGNDKAVNPALFHFVMPPWYLLFPFVFYYGVRPVVGFFDGRMALLFTMVMLLGAVWRWIKDKRLARIAVILTSLSPAVIDYFIEGRSDVFALSWLIVALVLLEQKRFIWSGVMLALAFLSKQTTWFILPFYALVLWLHTAKHRTAFWKTGIVGAVTVMVVVLPFFLWNPAAFLDSVVFYLSGNSPHSYPVAGYGLSMVLYEFGVIKDIHAYYPFILWQIGIGAPLFICLIRWVWRGPTQSKLMMSYAVFLMVFWYLSRYFNNSHLGYLSMLFVLAGLKGMDEARS